jgi:indolepyruvate ferredoxin oxidoreductase
LKRKIALGAWAVPIFRLLARAKVLRGTALDVFGRTRVRRLERALPVEYVEAIDQVLPRLRPANLDAAVEIATLVDRVRGYEEIKETRAAVYREELARRLAAFD